jgi:hypothetical protein
LLSLDLDEEVCQGPRLHLHRHGADHAEAAPELVVAVKHAVQRDATVDLSDRSEGGISSVPRHSGLTDESVTGPYN